MRVTEIFHSIQGETSRSGLPTVFIRLTGCPLRCGYCDTEYAFYGGKSISLTEIIDRVAQHRARYVTVTGGEPLAQKPCLNFLTLLCNAGYEVSLELRKIYEVLPDSVATRHRQLRVIDESGEDYLFPAAWFAVIELPAATKRAVLAAV